MGVREAKSVRPRITDQSGYDVRNAPPPAGRPAPVQSLCEHPSERTIAGGDTSALPGGVTTHAYELAGALLRPTFPTSGEIGGLAAAVWSDGGGGAVAAWGRRLTVAGGG